jgi:ABC-type phosphate/phosphonate transport system substrate-binding protein
MYAATPAAKQAWRDILGWALGRADLGWDVVDHDGPAPLAELWARDDLGCALMCGLPFSQLRPRPVLVAAPVPSLPRYEGRPIYFTDIAVAAASPVQSLEESFDGVVGFTARDSMSGYVAFRRHLLPYRQARGRTLYRKAVGGLLNASGVIRALADGRIDVGPLDSYSYDILKASAPAFAARVRTLASTAPAPIPPLVATAALTPTALAALRASLADVGRAPELAVQRRAILLEQFDVPAASSYDVFNAFLESSRDFPDPW